MKIRNLEAKYDNLHPDYVMSENMELLEESYQKLWNYARELEQNLKFKNSRLNKQHREIRHLNNSLSRKQYRIQIAKQFLRAFPQK
jgi:hypothetical protein